MSSFRRRAPTSPIPGSRPSPYNSLPLLSTGLASLDDILGGGLPLSSSLLLESDTPTAYAELLLKFWVSQGVECAQEVVVVASGLEGGPDEVIRTLPGVEGGAIVTGQNEKETVEEAEDDGGAKAEKMKIAFRYEGMRQHAVTVAAPTPRTAEADVYCSMFDLTTVRSLRAADRARLHLVDVDDLTSASGALPVDLYELLYQRLATLISDGDYALPQDAGKPRKALRIAISSLGSPAWGHSSPTALYSFLHRLRALLRTSSASALLTFPAHLYPSPVLLHRLSHAADGVISLQSFAASPLSLAAFPRHNGLLRIPKLPNVGSLVPPSVKLSVLRGLGGGEGNNLGFRVKRRRFVIETVNGDGPVGGEEVAKKPPVEKVEKVKEVKVELTGQLGRESVVRFAGGPEDAKVRSGAGGKGPSVAKVIHSNPELYDF